MSFNLIRSAGPFISDPRRLPRAFIPAGNVLRSYDASTVADIVSGFWTGGVGSIDRIPGATLTNSSWTANTYKTLVSYSGSGVLCNVIGPTWFDNPVTATCLITIDGVPYTITMLNSAAGQRPVIGWGLPKDAYHATTNYGFQHSAASPDGYTAIINNTAGFVLMGPQDPRIPFLVAFERSLLVEWKVASGGVDTVGEDARAAVIMMKQS